MGKTSAIVLFAIFSLLASCNDHSLHGSPGVLVVSGKTLDCTAEVSATSPEYSKYILSTGDGRKTGSSSDCRFASQLRAGLSSRIEVIIKEFDPKYFKNIAQCRATFPSPPAPNGARPAFDQILSELPYDSQVSLSVLAMSHRECFERVFPDFEGDGKSSVERIGIKSISFFNRNTGYDLSDAGGYTVVMPVGIFRRDHAIRKIACALFRYGRQEERFAKSEYYLACLKNLTDILHIRGQ